MSKSGKKIEKFFQGGIFNTKKIKEIIDFFFSKKGEKYFFSLDKNDTLLVFLFFAKIGLKPNFERISQKMDIYICDPLFNFIDEKNCLLLCQAYPWTQNKFLLKIATNAINIQIKEKFYLDEKRKRFLPVLSEKIFYDNVEMNRDKNEWKKQVSPQWSSKSDRWKIMDFSLCEEMYFSSGISCNILELRPQNSQLCDNEDLINVWPDFSPHHTSHYNNRPLWEYL